MKVSRGRELGIESLAVMTSYRFLDFLGSVYLFFLLAQRLFCTCGVFAL